MPTVGRRVLSLAVVPLASLALVAPAFATPDLGRASAMLTAADVPTGLRVTGGWEFTAEENTGLRPTLCTKNGVEIAGAVAPTLYQVELGERTTVGQHGLQQQVFEYPTEEAAQRAFGVIERKATLCRGTTRESEVPGGPTAKQRLTNGRTAVTVRGTPGVWVYSDYANSVATQDWADGGYDVFFLAGTSIHGMQYDIPDAIPTTKAARMKVNALGRDLADRWLAATP